MQYYREAAQNTGMMGQPIQPGLPVQPVQPGQPGQPGLPMQPVQPGMPGQFGLPVQTVQPGQQYNPMMNVSPQQLENMYPTTYNIVQPAVENACDNLMANKGPMHTPTQEELNKMVSDVYSNVEGKVEAASKKSQSERERQFFGTGRFLLNDLIAILLINSLIRRRPFYGYPGFYGGGFVPYSFGAYPYF